MNNEGLLSISPEKAFVAYSLPGSSDFSLHFSEVIKGDLNDENLDTYDFVIAPFQNYNESNYFLNFKESFINKNFSFISPYLKEAQESSKEEYMLSAETMIQQMKLKFYDKVVLSKLKLLKNNQTDLGELFKTLVAQYKSAFVFIFNLPNQSCWMGATPERLIKKNNINYSTVALAGTQVVTSSLENITWSQKEIEEQKYIQTFIETCFNEQAITYEKSKTYTHSAGKMCHLKTDYNFSNDVSSMSKLIKTLHPGPAISGMPKMKSLSVIKQFEKHKRNFYTGYLGILNKHSNLELFINLRSMEVSNKNFILYLGGGLTKDSVAENEWEETELKALTMSDLIINNH